MRLIIDSGSSKMGWIVMDGNEVKAHFVTQGFNPNYTDIQFLDGLVADVADSHGFGIPQSIHYYGTGCGTEQNCALVNDVFSKRFPKSQIHVTHDLMAACHALFGHSEGIACILGTGSNACVYDGANITERAVSLGYIAGDEGSGMHIGKEIVRAYFYGFMPEDLRRQFDDTYHLQLKDFVQTLYHGNRPSKYLASFAMFAGEHQQVPFVRALVKDCFDAFLKAYVCRFADCETLKISFVGSVAYHFRDILKETLDAKNLSLGEVMDAPATGLVRYYSE